MITQKNFISLSSIIIAYFVELEHYKETMKGTTADSNNIGRGYNDIIINLGDPIIGSRIIGKIRLSRDPLTNIQNNIGFGAKGRNIFIESGKVPNHSIDEFLKYNLPN